MRIEDRRILLKSTSTPGLEPIVSNSSSFNFKNLPINQIYPGELFWNQTDNKLWLAYQNNSGNIGSVLIYPQPITGAAPTIDVYVTGGTYLNGITTFTNNTGGTFNVTGYYTGTTNGGDTYVTGGTYSNGTATFTNNTGGTFNVGGFYTGGTDVFITGATYLNNMFTYTNNTGGTFNVLFNNITGLTSTGTISSNTLSAITYQNLPTDIRVTGGTYSNGTTTFINNTGGTFNVTGFYTGSTDVFTTGGTYSNGTVTFTNNTGGTFNVTGFFTGNTDIRVTGGTYSNGTATFTNNTGGTFNVTGFVSADTFTTAFTYSNNAFTLSRNQGLSNLTAIIDTVTGLTSTGTISSNTISATTYQNLPALSNTTAFATATTTVNTATYLDIAGCSITLAAGTWIIFGHVVGAAANAIIQCFVAIRDGSNNVISASAMSRPASGTASLNSPIGISWQGIVTHGSPTTYKLSAARGVTTHTTTWTVYDGTGYNTANHASDNSDKGTYIMAIKIG
jgi:hypothetical protein